MRFGVLVRSAGPGFGDAAAKMERDGVDSLWFDESSGDPLVMAAAAAVSTSQLDLVVMLDDPTSVTAKAVASLDAVSGGRVRVVVRTRAAIDLMRAMLSGGRVRHEASGIVDAPVLPAAVQEKVPVWTRNIDLADIADGVLIEEGVDLFRGTTVAVLIDGIESLRSRAEASRRLGAQEVVVSLDPGLWETVGKVLDL